MPPVFASKRRADEFAAVVDGAATEAGERYARLLGLVEEMRAVPAPAPRPEFAAALRARLLAEADTALVPVAARERAAVEHRLNLPVPARTSRDRRVALGLGSLAFLGAAAAVTVGAQVALPGDTLYPVKRAIEGVRTELAVGDENTGTIILAHASERLDETAALTRRAIVDTPATETGLRDFTDQAQGAAGLLTAAYDDNGEPRPIATLRDFTGDSMRRLSALEPALPPEARDELFAAADAVIAIDDEAAAACPSCGGAGVVVLPPNLVASAPTIDDPAVLPEDPGSTGGGGANGSPLPLPTGPGDGPSDLPTLPSGPLPSGPLPSGPLPTAPLPTAVPTLPLPTATKATPKLPLPTISPTALPTALPTVLPTTLPTALPTVLPTTLPTALPTALPSILPSILPTLLPTQLLTILPSATLPPLLP